MSNGKGYGQGKPTILKKTMNLINMEKYITKTINALKLAFFDLNTIMWNFIKKGGKKTMNLINMEKYITETINGLKLSIFDLNTILKSVQSEKKLKNDIYKLLNLG